MSPSPYTDLYAHSTDHKLFCHRTRRSSYQDRRSQTLYTGRPKNWAFFRTPSLHTP